VVTKDLLDCKSCNGISYCGKEHQQEHFKAGHKLVCKGRDKPLTFNGCVEKATKYYNEQMWVAALPYYSAILELIERGYGKFLLNEIEYPFAGRQDGHNLGCNIPVIH